MSRRMLLVGECLTPQWGEGGKGMWLWSCLSYLVITRSYDIFANNVGVAHHIHCLTRGGVAIFAKDT